MTSLGVDKMATGHYAQTQTSSDGEVYAQVILHRMLYDGNGCISF